MSTTSDDLPTVDTNTPGGSPKLGPSAPAKWSERRRVPAEPQALEAKQRVPRGFRWLQVHWQIKIVALIFAVALWFYTAGQVRVSTTVSVSIDETSIVGLPSGHRVASISPREFSIELSGPASVLRGIRDGSIHPRLELSTRALQEGMQTFALTPTHLGIDAEVFILGTNPATIEAITVTIGRVVTEHFWVEPPSLLDVPVGIKVEIALDRDQVEVTGAIQALAELRARNPRLQFNPITLTGIDASVTTTNVFTAPLRPLVPEGVKVGDVVAHITLTAVETRQRQIAVPIQLLSPANVWSRYTVQLAQSQVLVNVRGPAHLIDALDPASVLAYVDLRTIGELDRQREVPVLFVGPSWLRIEPANVSLKVVAVAADPAEQLPSEPVPVDAPADEPVVDPSEALPVPQP